MHGQAHGLETLESGVALQLIGSVSIWYDSAALKPESCFNICLLCFLTSFPVFMDIKGEKYVGTTATIFHSA